MKAARLDPESVAATNVAWLSVSVSIVGPAFHVVVVDHKRVRDDFG